MPILSRQYFLKEKEAKQLLASISEKLNVKPYELFGPKPRIERAETQIAEIFFINEKPIMAKSNEILFPTLKFEKLFAFLPKIVVNMGAVSHLCNGADVLAPGVVQIKGNFNEEDFLLIVDERHEKPLAIGVALVNSQVAKNLTRGKIAKNMHFVGDKLWNVLKSL
jgi:PUA domain protein